METAKDDGGGQEKRKPLTPNTPDYKDILKEVKSGKTWEITQLSKNIFNLVPRGETLYCASGRGSITYIGTIDFEDDPYTEIFIRYKNEVSTGVINNGASGTGLSGRNEQEIRTWSYISVPGKHAVRQDNEPWSVRKNIISNSGFRFNISLAAGGELLEVKFRKLKSPPQDFLREHGLLGLLE